MVDDVQPHPLFKVITWTDDQIYKAIDLYKDRIKTLQELAQELLILHGPLIEYKQEDIAQFITAKHHSILTV